MLKALRSFVKGLSLALDYERCRASSGKVALQAFISSLPDEISRIRILGLSNYLRLVGLERACAEAGLSFPRQAPSVGPPWRFPPEFFQDAVSALPPHPLIDPERLRQLVKTKFPDGQADSTDALRSLLAWGQQQSKHWNAVAASSQRAGTATPEANIAVCLHVFYPEMWDELNSALASIPEPFDLFITIPNFACTPILERILVDRPGTRIFASENRGRDVLPFLRLLRQGVFKRYEVVCKLHTKRSPHMKDGEHWRKKMLSSLLGDRGEVARIITQFRSEPRLALLGPAESLVEPGGKTHLGTNSRWMRLLGHRVGLSDLEMRQPFFAGTMFWFRPSALSCLASLPIQENEFPLEMAQTDGTPAHAIERLIWPMLTKAGFQIGTVSDNGIVSVAKAESPETVPAPVVQNR